MEKRVIMSSRDIDSALQRIALQILEKNHDFRKLAIVGIHTCGVFVAEKYMR
jgi:pyrimidine operon attenuation protein/uracil phosphoribosyltransferase